MNNSRSKMKISGGAAVSSSTIGNNALPNARVTIGLTKATKEKLDRNRAPGQCYDGFICQLVDLWEKIKDSKQEYILNTSKGR